MESVTNSRPGGSFAVVDEVDIYSFSSVHMNAIRPVGPLGSSNTPGQVRWSGVSVLSESGTVLGVVLGSGSVVLAAAEVLGDLRQRDTVLA